MTITQPDTPAAGLAPPIVIGIDPSLTGTGIASSNGWVEVIGYRKSRSKDPGITAVSRRWPDWTTEGNDNAADAVVLMAAGRDWLGAPITDMPKTHRAALDKAVWPTLPGAAA